MRCGFLLIILLCSLSVTVPLVAQPMEAPAATGDIYYVTSRVATVFRTPSTDTPYIQLGFREPVYVLDTTDGWHRVRAQDGALGYVPEEAVSNVWLRVSKRKKAVYLYRGTELVTTYPADFGYNAFADKERRGSTSNPDDWRTPEGVFFVVRKNPHSQFYKAFVLNYPNTEDAERGLREGLISRGEYEAIVRSERDFTMPPMHTALGGMIEIHGDGTGVSSNWTQGCVAVHNEHMDALWDRVHVGTPVLVER